MSAGSGIFIAIIFLQLSEEKTALLEFDLCLYFYLSFVTEDYAEITCVDIIISKNIFNPINDTFDIIYKLPNYCYFFLSINFRAPGLLQFKIIKKGDLLLFENLCLP